MKQPTVDFSRGDNKIEINIEGKFVVMEREDFKNWLYAMLQEIKNRD